MRTRRRKDKLAMPEIVLTPLIDTALTLLVIFMVATPIIQNSIDVDLPRSMQKPKNQKDIEDLRVYIDKNEKFYLENVEFSVEHLISEIKERVGNKKEQTVYVGADRNVSHGTVCEFVDKLKYLGGIKNVSLATKVA